MKARLCWSSVYEVTIVSLEVEKNTAMVTLRDLEGQWNI